MSLEKLSQSGAYSLPWLIKISKHDGTGALNFINDVQNLNYQGTEYIASSFDFEPNADVLGLDGGGSLEITVTDNALIELIESNYNLKISVVGVILDNQVAELETVRSLHCTVSWDGLTAKFEFDSDDRLGMTFPALIFNHYNNRGNM